MITIIHKPCNGIAFFYEHMPRAGEQFDVEYAFDINGNPLTWNSSRLCPTCGRPMSIDDFAPGPPVLRTFDMSSPQDMRSFYEDAGETHMDGVA